MSSLVRIEKNGHVALLKLCDPLRLNALTVDMGKCMKDRVKELNSDPRIRCVVLTGEGRAFSAGGDLKFLRDRTLNSPESNSLEMRDFYDRFLSIRSLKVPTISAINGHAVGAGLCISLLTDLRVASTTAKLGFNFVQIGLHPGMAVTHYLPRLVGDEVSNRLLLTGELISGQEANALGLVTKSVNSVCIQCIEKYNVSVLCKDEVLKESMNIAKSIAMGSPIAIRQLIKTQRAIQDVGLESCLVREADAQALCYACSDIQEGITAIMEKRQPHYPNS